MFISSTDSHQELRSRQFWQGILAETLGSLVFVSAVLGSLVPGPDGASPGPIYPALAAGMATVVLGYCFGEISGAQVPVEMNAGQALGMEMLATFLLGFTVFSVEDQRRREINEPGNLAIGFAVTTAIFIAVYWIGPILGAVLAGVSHEFIFAPSASRQKLVACLTCKDIEIVETASVSRSSLSTVTQSAMRNKQNNKLEHS
ncbi:aquaporin-4-like protein [Labeo rohita]|uniref:Aquaporin-4-like protein n=1 Tax=Labeo rohita TaxID=84645 RepID=A0A498NGC4_LABRO|nr:aquaporin-4-like protein [Labeo rohita]